jgi:DNA-binding MarR family transcriptional regulator
MDAVVSNEVDRSAVTGLAIAIQSFLKTGVAIAGLQAFLSVARNPNRTCAELAKLEGVPLPTMSRWLLTLGHMNIGLAQTRAEAGDARYVRHSLTAKGIELLRKMVTRR